MARLQGASAAVAWRATSRLTPWKRSRRGSGASSATRQGRTKKPCGAWGSGARGAEEEGGGGGGLGGGGRVEVLGRGGGGDLWRDGGGGARSLFAQDVR